MQVPDQKICKGARQRQRYDDQDPGNSTVAVMSIVETLDHRRRNRAQRPNDEPVDRRGLICSTSNATIRARRVMQSLGSKGGEQASTISHSPRQSSDKGPSSSPLRKCRKVTSMPAVAPRYSADHRVWRNTAAAALDDNAVQTLIAAIHEEPKWYLEGLGHLEFVQPQFERRRHQSHHRRDIETGAGLVVGQAPSSSTCPASRPISSVVSRRAATTGLSSWASTRPPGKLICPGW